MNRNELPGRSPAWCLSCMLAGAAIAGAAGAQVQAPAAEDSKAGSTASTYRVINLGAGTLSSLPRMNDKGQVAFSLFNEGTGSRGYFYNGSTVQDVGTFGGDTYAVDLNNAGQVAGRSATPLGVDRAFIWSAATGIRTLSGPPASAYSVATAINNMGVVIGVHGGNPGGYRWSASEGYESLGALSPGGEGGTFPTALNDAGLIAGNSRVVGPPNEDHLVAWTRATGLVDIDTLSSAYALPTAVSERGEIVGSRLATSTSTRYHAFVWTRATGMVDVGTGRGVESGLGAINDQGLAAGIINYADDTQHGAWWTRSTGLRDIGTFGGRFSRTHDVNNLGQIVGSADSRAGQDRAFVWTAKTGLADLNTRLRRTPPGLVLDDAVAISDNGAIVATSNAGLVLLQPQTSSGHKGGHALGPVQGPATIKAGKVLAASVGYIDEDRVGTRSSTWAWGDGSGSQAGRVREANGSGSTAASHSYAAAGTYQITVTVVDRNGRSSAVGRSIVVTP